MRILTLFLISLIFISCAKVNPNYFQSSFTAYEKKVNYNKIADDFIQLLSSYYPPNKTTLFLNEEKSNKDFFDYFILSIRKKGYAISNDNSRKNLTFLSYQISQIDNETIVAIFNVDESKVSMIYSIVDNKLIKTSITNFNFNSKY